MRGPLCDLPHDVLCNIMSLADQPTRVACMTSVKALSRAARSQGVWASVTFSDLDNTALEFMDVHRVPTVMVRTACPDDVSWFAEKLAGSGIDCVRHLDIEVSGAYRMNYCFLDALAKLKSLETLRLVMSNLERDTELAFPRWARLPNLRCLDIIEQPSDDLMKRQYVFFNGSHAGFPKLERLVVDVCGSDVMAGLCHMPSLRSVAYRSDEDVGDETYEDAQLEGCTLDALVIDLGMDTDYQHLCSELHRASVKRLVLCVDDTTACLMHRINDDIQELVVRFNCSHADVCLDFVYLRGYKDLRSISVEYEPWIEDMIERDSPACVRHSLEFRHVPSLIDFCGWAAEKVQGAHARIVYDPN